jgi:hypothetical protein
LKPRRSPSSSRRGRHPSNTTNRGPVLQSAPISNLLSSTPTSLNCSYLAEPQLLFGGKALCVDPRTGLAAYGPYSKTDASRRTAIRVGIVGPADAIDRAVALIERFSQPIDQSEKVDAVLHPPFPGLNAGDPFQVEIVSHQIWRRPLKPADVVLVEGDPDFKSRIGRLLSAVLTEIRALKALDSGPDVVIVAMSQKLEELCRVGIAKYESKSTHEASDEDDSPSDEPEDLEPDSAEAAQEDDETEADPDDEGARSFRRGLKAQCLNLLPTQLLWHRTLAGTRGVQDLATRAWNLTVALLYKSQIIPWRLVDVLEGSCFIGVSFFHDDEARSSTLRTSVAQAFTERGEGFILQGDSFEWDPKREVERSPHLSRQDAKKLLERVLQTYTDQLGGQPPRKVVLHKSSRFTPEERSGFEEALASVPHYGMITIQRRGIFCLRPGNKATLRGTAIDFGDKRGLIYTMGYVPFLRCYTGFRVPQPLEILENWGSVSFREAAEDILRLTKLNWNTAAFNCRDPITMAFARRVGEILKMAKGNEPALYYRFYM